MLQFKYVKKRFLIAPSLLFALNFSASAVVNTDNLYLADEKSLLIYKNVKNIKITFNAEINQQSIKDLTDIVTRWNTKIFPQAAKSARIYLYINSPGGDLAAGIAAYNALRNSTIPIITYNAGLTASAATFLYCASAYRYASPYSKFLLHSPRYYIFHPVEPFFIQDQQIRFQEKVFPFMEHVYNTCFAQNSEISFDLKALLKSEHDHLFWNKEEAVKATLSKEGPLPQPKNFDAIYIIKDNE